MFCIMLCLGYSKSIMGNVFMRYIKNMHFNVCLITWNFGMGSLGFNFFFKWGLKRSYCHHHWSICSAVSYCHDVTRQLSPLIWFGHENHCCMLWDYETAWLHGFCHANPSLLSDSHVEVYLIPCSFLIQMQWFVQINMDFNVSGSRD